VLSGSIVQKLEDEEIVVVVVKQACLNLKFVTDFGVRFVGLEG